ncbi:MAG: cupin domain-containing protein [Methanomassiliicoccus sp.]|nr:cupin domain-containing protein [Methanomassiliicoccus sp.]
MGELMKVVKLSEVAPKPNPPAPGVTVRKIIDSEHALVTHMTMRPGESVTIHGTPVDVYLFILEGEGKMQIGDEVQTIGKDMIVYSPANIPHRVMNPGSENLIFLAIKVPRP